MNEAIPEHFAGDSTSRQRGKKQQNPEDGIHNDFGLAYVFTEVEPECLLGHFRGVDGTAGSSAFSSDERISKWLIQRSEEQSHFEIASDNPFIDTDLKARSGSQILRPVIQSDFVV